MKKHTFWGWPVPLQWPVPCQHLFFCGVVSSKVNGCVCGGGGGGELTWHPFPPLPVSFSLCFFSHLVCLWFLWHQVRYHPQWPGPWGILMPVH